MDRLIFNAKQFSEGGYSKVFLDVISALQKSGVIMSEEPSETAFKVIHHNAWEDGAEYDVQKETPSESVKRSWEQLKKEL